MQRSVHSRHSLLGFGFHWSEMGSSEASRSSRPSAGRRVEVGLLAFTLKMLLLLAVQYQDPPTCSRTEEALSDEESKRLQDHRKQVPLPELDPCSSRKCGKCCEISTSNCKYFKMISGHQQNASSGYLELVLTSYPVC